MADAGAVPATLTRSQRREILRRQTALNRVAELKASGLSEVKAAKALRLSPVSLWRWRHNLIPATDRCGRHSVLSTFKINDALIARVQKFQVAGCSRDKAWRALASDAACPPALAEFLRQSPKLPASFFEAARLKRVRTTVLIGKNFSHIQSLDVPC
ncbi:MAG: hypothetical protein WBW41_14820 [Verrucomicrobiia bacterium]